MAAAPAAADPNQQAGQPGDELYHQPPDPNQQADSDQHAQGDLQGFVLDPDSGQLYNSDLGYYFDPQRMLWRDAWTGQMYRMLEGQYVPVQEPE